MELKGCQYQGCNLQHLLCWSTFDRRLISQVNWTRVDTIHSKGNNEVCYGRDDHTRLLLVPTLMTALDMGMHVLIAIIYNQQALTKYRRKVWSPVPSPTEERIPRPTQYAHQNNKDFNWLRDCKQLTYSTKLNVLVLT